MIDPTIAADAAQLVLGDRRTAYGDSLTRVAGLWSAYLGVDVSARDAAWMMALVKAARSRGSYKRDNFVDAVGYVLLAEALPDP